MYVHMSRCKHLLYHLHLDARQSRLGALQPCFRRWCSLTQTQWHTHTHHTHKRHFPAARGSHLVGPNRGRASTRLPVPICVDVSDVNMHPVNFHMFVIASPASTEASHSRPPSWSCWERLDLWQCGLFPARSGAVASLHWEASSRGKPGWEETQADHPMSPS